MISFEEVRDILDTVIESLPPEIFQRLNGGVILREDTVRHPESVGDDLFILGNYNYQPAGLGRFILIYYGSFVRLYGNSPRRVQQRKLREVLCHELVHHLESLAGERGLELEDARNMQIYRDRLAK